MMNQYAFFSGSTYYPSGGWEEFKASSDNLDTFKPLIQAIQEQPEYKWWHIVDFELGKIIDGEKWSLTGVFLIWNKDFGKYMEVDFSG